MLSLLMALILTKAPGDRTAEVHTTPFKQFDAEADLVIPMQKGWLMGCSRPPAERLGLPKGVTGFSSQVDTVDPSLLRDFRRAIRSLPDPIDRLFEAHVCSVVFVTGLSSTAQVRLLGRETPRSHGIMLIGDRIDASANAWFTDKEKSPFSQAPGFEIRARMATGDNDSRQRLIEYVISHELAHILEYQRPVPRVVSDFLYLGRGLPPEFPSNRGWYFADMTGVERLPSDFAYILYSATISQGLASPYAFTSPSEDLAESFALYVHCVLLKRPWSIQLVDHGTPIVTLDDCWGAKRCEKRRELVEEFLKAETTRIARR